MRQIGRYERLCRERNQRDLDLARGGHPRGFRFSQEAADYAVNWIQEYGRHHKGEWAGKPLILEPWQAENIRTIFGWKRADGSRRFRRVWWHTPRKQGKTQIAAAVALYLLVGDSEPGAEVYTTATKKEQAAICHEAARAMVRKNAVLAQAIKVPKNAIANLTCAQLGSKMAVLASDHGTLDGLNPHGDIRDEVAEWTAHELATVLDTATGSRRQPLTFEITTAGVYDPEGVGWQHHEYATSVLEGRLEDDTLFAYVTAIEDGDDPWDPAVWAKACPNLGVSLKLEYMEDQAVKARTQMAAQNGFLQKLLNRWTQQTTRWLNADRWREAEDATFSERDLEGLECVAGLDLSLRNDPSALVLLFRRPDDGIDLTCRFWLPESTVEEEARRGRTYWRAWAEQGWLDVVPGDTIRHSHIRDEIKELSERFRIAEFGFDPAHANLLAGELSDDGHTMVEVRQGPLTMSEPSKLFEAQVFARKIRATGRPGGPNPILRWMVGNAVAHVGRTGLVQPDKAKARGKIDGVTAAICALSRIVGNDSVAPYDGESLTFV